MKTKSLLILLIFSVQLSFSQDNKYLVAEINTEIFCDHCLQCESCDDNIFSKIKDHNKGVMSVKVDSKQNLIIVKYNKEKTNLTAIEKAITMSGYKANGQKPMNDAYEKLDHCCKKNS